ncbi:Ig-like domain-containing protein [Metaplanococcus flavidus]
MSKRPSYKKLLICILMFSLVFQMGTGFVPVHAANESKLLTVEEGKFTKVAEFNAASTSAEYTFTTENQYWSSGVVYGDLYIGPNSVVTINGNVTVTGNVYVYGALVSYGGLYIQGALNAQSIMYGSSSTLYQGSANMRGGSNSISSMIVSNQAYDVPLAIYSEELTNENGFVTIEGKTLPFLDVSIQGIPVSLETDGTFSAIVEDISAGSIEINLQDVFGYNIKKYLEVKDVLPPAAVSGFTVSKENKDNIQVKWDQSADSDVYQYALYLNGELVEHIPADRTDYTFANLDEGTVYELAIAAVDFSNNESGNSNLTATTLLSKPLVYPVSPEATAITGQAFPGTVITVKSGEIEIGKGTTDTTGKFKISITSQKIGTALNITASNSLGIVSEKTSITVEDKTAPSIPEVNVINDKDLVITGTAEANSNVKATLGQALIGEGQADAAGKFSFQIAKQKAGSEISVTATDASGNISEAKVIAVLDVTAPAAPTVNKVTDSSVVVTGVAEAGAKVTVKTGSTVVNSSIASADGNYSVAIPKQKIGTVVSVAATDAAGNVSAVVEVTVFDGTAPAVALMNNITHHSTRAIGTAEADAQIEVLAGTKSIGTAKADSTGKYEVTIEKQKVGTKLSIVATDAAGNSSKPILVTVADGNYPDLKITHWALEEIMYLADDQIIGGYPNGEFQSEKKTTRAEAAKMLVLALDLPLNDVSSGYKDVTSKHWAKNYIAAASKAGLFNGNPDGTFAPDKTLKRSEMAKIISIAYDFKASGQNHFTDVKSGYWAKGYISGLYDNGITTGYPDDTFRAEESTTRAEFSVFLARALNKEFR